MSAFWLAIKPSQVTVTESEVLVARRIGHSRYPVESSSVEVVELERLGRVNTMIALRRRGSRWRSVIRLSAFPAEERIDLRRALLAFQRRADQMLGEQSEGDSSPIRGFWGSPDHPVLTGQGPCR